MAAEPTTGRIPIRDLVRYYLPRRSWFGGPVALVGQMERELVGEKKWLTKEEMREGIAVCQSLPGPARDPGRHLDLVHPWRLLGGMGRRLGIHPAEFHHRYRAWRTLRSVRRAAGRGRHFLRSESCRHRVDPSFVLPVDQVWDEGLVGMGARRRDVPAAVQPGGLVWAQAGLLPRRQWALRFLSSHGSATWASQWCGLR
jgi:chromate transporter